MFAVGIATEMEYDAPGFHAPSRQSTQCSISDGNGNLYYVELLFHSVIVCLMFNKCNKCRDIISVFTTFIPHFMIRQAVIEDIPRLMEIFTKARDIMRTSGNLHQWNDNYPSKEIVMKDIDDGNCFVLCEEEDGNVIATMAFIKGPDPTYAQIFNGTWVSDRPYYVIHRIAVAEPGHNAAMKLFDWGFQRTGSIRIDTHKDNVIMHHVLSKYGFRHCGMIHLANGSPREAYQMDI